eukprot:NODE_18389_length_895_cov_5.746094.p3 GENE.NODE_18389_length_895_cov_5.746094~~NODE_18389_length_895_cov_5.746094.p3  ORF type:complete len:203 (-),score=50.78 NODE_18389_length_895_cov_5.746094:133-741(-)
MCLVTGGLGGLGLIASMDVTIVMKCPVVTTSRSGRPASHAIAQGLFQALAEEQPLYTCICNVSRSQELADMMHCLARPGLPTRRRLVTLGDCAETFRRMMYNAPAYVLEEIQDATQTIVNSLFDTITFIQGPNTTKIDTKLLRELEESKIRYELLSCECQQALTYRTSSSTTRNPMWRDDHWQPAIESIRQMKASFAQRALT